MNKQEQIKKIGKIESMNRWLVWVLLFAIGVLIMNLAHYNSIQNNNTEIKNSLIDRFTIYDFSYFIKYHRFVKNIGKTGELVCIDISKKVQFYTGTREITPFYNQMDELDCDILSVIEGVSDD
jgi:hypothetical protein